MPKLLSIHNEANLAPDTLQAIIKRIEAHTTLEKLIAAGFAVSDIRAADEFSLDALVPIENGLWLVYHLT